MTKSKAIIIGSGLGGLSSGVILAKHGYDVTIVEQQAHPGGCLQCFSREGVRFETGMHFLGSLDPGQTLYRLFDYLEILPDIKLSRLDTSAYNIVSFNGDRFRFVNGYDYFKESLLSDFPSEGKSIDKYFDTVKLVASLSGLDHMQSGELSSLMTKYQMLSIEDVMKETINNPQLRDVLCGDLPLYAGVLDKTPFALHGQLMDFYNQSSFRIRGGSDRIALSMINTISRYGGQVMTNSKVTKVICDNTKAIGIEVNNDKVYYADVFISSIHPQVLLPLLDTSLIRPAYRSRIASIPNTPSVFSLYLKFKENTMPYMNSNFYGYKNYHPWNCETYDETNWPKSYLYMHFCPEKESQWAQSGVVLSYMSISECKKWENTNVNHRGSDYIEWKKRKAQQMINALEKDHPGIKEKIESYYTASPLTYRDYNSTPEGALYGIVKDVQAGPAYRISYRTRITNLLLTGQNINSHGALGVLVGTLMACGNLLGPEKLIIK